MATQVFLREFVTTASVSYRALAGTSYVCFDGASRNFDFIEANTSRGDGVNSVTWNTVAGPTSGHEIIFTNLIDIFATPPISSDVTIAGSITINFWALESSMNANAAINCRIVKWAAVDGALTEIAKTARVTELGTSAAVQNFSVTPTSTALARGDRILIVPFVDDSSGATLASGFTVTLNVDAASAGVNGDSYVTFTETFGFESAPAGTTVYLTDTASDVATADVDREAWTSRGAGVQTDVTNTAAGPTAKIQVTDTAGGTAVSWFTKQLAATTLSGPVLVNVRGLESNFAANASLLCEIARVDSDGTNPSVWGLNGELELGSTEEVRSFWVTGDDLAISDGQRLRIRLFIDDAYFGANTAELNSLAASHTVTSHYAGTSGGASGDAFVTFTQTLTEFVVAAPRVPRFSSMPQLLAH